MRNKKKAQMKSCEPELITMVDLEVRTRNKVLRAGVWDGNVPLFTRHGDRCMK